MAGAGKLEIDVQVRLDKLESQLKQVEATVNKTGRKVEATAGKFDKMAQGIGRGSALTAKLAIAAAAIDAGIKGATAQVHLMKGAFALLKGDTDGALKSLEAYGETIRSLPIIGGILGGIADGIFNLTDAVTGITENLEELEKQLVKVKAQGEVASMALGIKRQNNLLKQQIQMLKEKSEFAKADIALSMEMAALDEKRKQMVAAVTNEHTKGTREHMVAVEQIDQQIALQKEILQIQHDQNAEQMIAAEQEKRRAEGLAEAKRKLREEAEALKRIENAEGTIAALEDQLRIATAQTDVEKRRATMMAQQKAIMREFAEQQKQINADETLTNEQRQQLLDLLTKEKNIKIDLVRLADDAARKAEREAELQRKRTEELKKQKAALEEQQRLDEKRSSELGNRLGLASVTDAPKKSGFTETASTAMGSFTFGEVGAQEKIRALQKEQLDLQKTMEQRLQAIEGFAKQLAENVGF